MYKKIKTAYKNAPSNLKWVAGEAVQQLKRVAPQFVPRTGKEYIDAQNAAAGNVTPGDLHDAIKAKLKK